MHSAAGAAIGMGTLGMWVGFGTERVVGTREIGVLLGRQWVAIGGKTGMVVPGKADMYSRRPVLLFGAAGGRVVVVG